MNKNLREKTKTLSQTSQDLMEELSNALETHDWVVRWNMKKLVRGFLWKLVLEFEFKEGYGSKKDRLEADLDIIVDKIIETSRYTDRGDGENYSIWDEKDVALEMERVMTLLKKVGTAVDYDKT